MSNTALMKQKLARLKAKQQTLNIEGKGLARDIAPLINPTLQDVVAMDVARAATKMDELLGKQGDLISLQNDIWDLEEELGC